jgi:hypothetical protein
MQVELTISLCWSLQVVLCYNELIIFIGSRNLKAQHRRRLKKFEHICRIWFGAGRSSSHIGDGV